MSLYPRDIGGLVLLMVLIVAAAVGLIAAASQLGLMVGRGMGFT